ncbi:MAG: response regulator [Gammaproteobacteria bacterium]|jgi:CheY-like chemotaxis protein
MGKILIVDDDEDLRDAMQLVLESAGHEVELASNGDEAISLHRITPADIIIVDIIMPVKDGVTTVKVLRSEFPGIRIIAISGGGSIEPVTYQPEALTTSAYLAAAKKAGADRVLTKPFERSDIVEAIDELLNRIH